MSKNKTVFFCTNCGYETPKWLGKCPVCNSWNTFSEEVVSAKSGSISKSRNELQIVKMNGNVASESARISTKIDEFDRVLGGGLMPGSLVLVGGDPGIGKSTLLMQVTVNIEEEVLYVTGEESINQINLRANRLGINSEKVNLLSEINLETIFDAVKKVNPRVLIIDSIQTIFDPEIDNAAGTITQVRETTAKLMQLSKSTNLITIIIGHITKEGFIAGPKILEHIVDTVLQFEGEKNHTFRILRALKNRFGNTNEIGVFEMFEKGLRQVENPSQIFLNQKEENAVGSVITSSIEGTRPILLEVQALTTPMNYGNPQRVATGIDYSRLSILLAVLEKRAKFRMGTQNVFINIAGGFKIFEPAIDLAVIVALASSLHNITINNDDLFIGEVGLGGEIRTVSNIEKRISEAEKMGIRRIFLPKGNMKSISAKSAELIPVENINKVFEIVLN